MAAAHEANAEYDAARKQRAAELERARYDVQLAKRRCEQVDPACRLVAANLEADYERALAALRTLEERHAAEALARPLTITPEVLTSVREVAGRLSEVWAAPSTTDQDRKVLLRLFVLEIRVVTVAPQQFEVAISWVGGAVTQHAVLRDRAARIVARELRQAGLTPTQIAEELNRRGFRTPIHHRPYTREGVRAMLRWGLPPQHPPREPWLSHREHLRAPVTELLSAGLKDAAVVKELNRRGLKTFRGGRWNGPTLRHLLLALGLRQRRGDERRASD